MMEQRENPMEIAAHFHRLVSNVCGRHRLPPRVHAMIKDDATNKIFGAFMKVTYDDPAKNDLFRLDGDKYQELEEDGTVADIAYCLAKYEQDVPLMLDPSLAATLDDASVTWLDRASGHAKLIGLDKGRTLEVYVGYNANTSAGNDFTQQVYLE